MREVQIIIRDDFDGEPEAETITFGWLGKTYEVDLGPDNREQLEKALRPYLDVARPAKSEPARQPANRADDRPITNIERARQKLRNGEHIPEYLHRTAELVRVRDWATTNGWPNITDRARLPVEAHDAYNRAHPNDYIEPPTTPGTTS